LTYTLYFCSLFYSPCRHRHLHSFPTRRSSDLVPGQGIRAEVDGVAVIIGNSRMLPQGVMLVVSHDLEAAGKTLLYVERAGEIIGDRKSTRLNSSHLVISYAVFCLKKKTT